MLSFREVQNDTLEKSLSYLCMNPFTVYDEFLCSIRRGMITAAANIKHLFPPFAAVHACNLLNISTAEAFCKLKKKTES